MWNWFANVFVPVLRQIVHGFLAVTVGWFALAWGAIAAIWAIVAGVLIFSIWGLSQIKGIINGMDFATLDVLKPASGMIHFYLFINRFVPLDEAFAGCLVCFTIWLSVTLVRWIKSFIPTIAN